jgi:hypothetical protein
MTINMLPNISPEETVRQGNELADRVWPMLNSYHPAAMGTALSYLVARWLTNFQDDFGTTSEQREELLSQHIEVMRDLVARWEKAEKK